MLVGLALVSALRAVKSGEARKCGESIEVFARLALDFGEQQDFGRQIIGYKDGAKAKEHGRSQRQDGVSRAHSFLAACHYAGVRSMGKECSAEDQQLDAEAVNVAPLPV